MLDVRPSLVRATVAAPGATTQAVGAASFLPRLTANAIRIRGVRLKPSPRR
jgi:hypothetical protein